MTARKDPSKVLPEDIGREVLSSANRLLFYPQPGPQTDLLAFKGVPEVLFGGARGGGKGLALSEEILTTSGWTTIEDLAVGDVIFDANGAPTTVLYKSEPTRRACYRLTFDNGQQIIADDVHRWITYSKAERVSNYKCSPEYREKRKASRKSRAKTDPVNAGSQKTVTELNKSRVYQYKELSTGTMRDTQKIFETLKVNNGREVNHAIKLAGVVQHSEKDLPIPPYVLGVWLGDGSRSSGRLTIGQQDSEELVKELYSFGYSCTQSKYDAITYKIERDRPFITELKQLGVSDSKHIPENYLIASAEQRLELLQGLFDTDGYCAKDGQIEFCNTNENLARGVFELLASFGVKPFITTKTPLCTNGKNGPVKGTKAWIVKATTNLPVFRLSRKKERLPTTLRETQKWHYITNVEPVESVWTQCLTVDSPTHTFLVSRSFIPTHNTAALLGDFVSDVPTYRSHWIGVLFRRTYPELEEVIRQSFEFYPQTGATYNANEKMWKWGNGAKLYLRYMAHPRDAVNYQGHQFCLAVGEKVQTPKGGIPIECLKVGDYVMTGSGWGRVLGVTAPVDKPCVKVEKSDGTAQVHPVDHEILCDSGWQSYSSLLGKASKEFQVIPPESDTLPSVDVLVRCVRPVPLGLQSEEQTSKLFHEFGKQSGLSDGYISTALQPSELNTSGLPPLQSRHLQTQDCVFSKFSVDVGRCGPTEKESQGFQPDYLTYCRSNDEYLHAAKGSDQGAFPSRADVEGPLLFCFGEGAQGNTQIGTHSAVSTYLHPYVGSELGMAWDNSLEACSISYVGVKTCVDIHVEAVNNYITASTGILNKNCWIGFDELGNFATDEGYQRLIACLRSPHNVPLKRIRATANPGGIGHGWVKERFQIATHPEGYKLIEAESGLNRMFIPSRVKDNLILLKNDPSYVERLKEVGSPEMVRAWLYGDWDVVAGAYFPEFSQELVTDSIDVGDIPNHWKIYRAYDHGTYHPFCVLWYTFAGEDWKGIKKGTIVILREWYGGNEKGEGFKMSLVDIREGLVEREATFNRRVEPGPADNQIFENHGGQSIADAFAVAGIYFARSDKARIPGWNQVRLRLKEKSVLFCRSCKHLIRTLPMLQHDEAKPEDVDTRGEDHCSDVLRYITMVYPVIPKYHRKDRKGKDGNAATWADLVSAEDDLTQKWRL